MCLTKREDWAHETRNDRLIGLLLLATSFGAIWVAQEHQQDWTNYVRIGAYGPKSEGAETIAAMREMRCVRYRGGQRYPGPVPEFSDPTGKLKDIRAVAEAAHKDNNKAFVYIAGTECITANADKSAHFVMKDHPDWVQRKITGEPAVFASGAGFLDQRRRRRR